MSLKISIVLLTVSIVLLTVNVVLLNVNGFTPTPTTIPPTPTPIIVNGVIKQDYDALVALYNATDGSNWEMSYRWLSNRHVREWGGVAVNGRRVTELSLSRNNLSGSIPPELGQLTNLWLLDLGYNDLSGSIPPELGQLNKLSLFLLYDNPELTGTIPQTLCGEDFEDLVHYSNTSLTCN